jgi:hypothetical protein
MTIRLTTPGEWDRFLFSSLLVLSHDSTLLGRYGDASYQVLNEDGVIIATSTLLISDEEADT